MSKREYLTIIFIGILSLGTIQAQWNKEKCPTDYNLNAISLLSSNSGWIVGEKGTILYKSEGVWRDYKKPAIEDLISVFMIDKNNGWAVGANGTIIHFNGKNWETVNSPTKNNLFSVSFKDSENGIAVGDLGTILKYRNGQWSLVENDNRGSFYTVSFEEENAWIGGGLECVNVPIIKMGINKKNLINSFDPNSSINSIAFLNENNGWAVGSPSTLLHFDGQHWERSSIGYNFSSLKSVFFADENNGITVGYDGTILVYRGYVWEKEVPHISQNLHGCFIVESTYYAVGENGTILSKPMTEKVNLADRVENDNFRIEIYPNPCNEILNVSLVNQTSVSDLYITITNQSGQVLMQREFAGLEGSNKFQINTAHLENGLYFLNNYSGYKVSTLKFIIKH